MVVILSEDVILLSFIRRLAVSFTLLRNHLRSSCFFLRNSPSAAYLLPERPFSTSACYVDARQCTLTHSLNSPIPRPYIGWIFNSLPNTTCCSGMQFNLTLRIPPKARIAGSQDCSPCLADGVSVILHGACKKVRH